MLHSGGHIYVMASNSELSLIPSQEMLYETLKGAFELSLFILWLNKRRRAEVDSGASS